MAAGGDEAQPPKKVRRDSSSCPLLLTSSLPSPPAFRFRHPQKYKWERPSGKPSAQARGEPGSAAGPAAAPPTTQADAERLRQAQAKQTALIKQVTFLRSQLQQRTQEAEQVKATLRELQNEQQQQQQQLQGQCGSADGPLWLFVFRLTVSLSVYSPFCPLSNAIRAWSTAGRRTRGHWASRFKAGRNSWSLSEIDRSLFFRPRLIIHPGSFSLSLSLRSYRRTQSAGAGELGGSFESDDEPYVPHMSRVTIRLLSFFFTLLRLLHLAELAATLSQLASSW